MCGQEVLPLTCMTSHRSPALPSRLDFQEQGRELNEDQSPGRVLCVHTEDQMKSSRLDAPRRMRGRLGSGKVGLTSDRILGFYDRMRMDSDQVKSG